MVVAIIVVKSFLVVMATLVDAIVVAVAFRGVVVLGDTTSWYR